MLLSNERDSSAFQNQDIFLNKLNNIQGMSQQIPVSSTYLTRNLYFYICMFLTQRPKLVATQKYYFDSEGDFMQLVIAGCSPSTKLYICVRLKDKDDLSRAENTAIRSVSDSVKGAPVHRRRPLWESGIRS